MNLVANLIISLSFVFSPPPLLPFEDSVLVLYVTDTEDRPITNITITCTGDCSQARSIQGKARIKLPPQTRSGESVTLQIVKLANDPDWVLISPWNNQVIIPSFDNRASNAIQIVVGKRGDKQILTSGKAIHSITKRIVNEMGKTIDKKLGDVERRDALNKQASIVGASPEKIDKAILAWGNKSQDPYEKGIAAYYSGNYAEASKLLAESLKQKTITSKELTFEYQQLLRQLAWALLQEKKFEEALYTYNQLLQLKKYDDKTLDLVIFNLTSANRFTDAEILVRKRIELIENAPAIDLDKQTRALYQLGYILDSTGKDDEAEAIYFRIIDLHSKCDYCSPFVISGVTSYLSSFAIRHKQSKNYVKAEILCREVLKQEERYYGKKNSYLIPILTLYAGVCIELQKYDEAEALYKRALEIISLPGRDEFHVTSVMVSMGKFYRGRERYEEAEVIYKQYLAIFEEISGKGHSNTIYPMRFLAYTYLDQKKYSDSEALFKQALSIAEARLGVSHHSVGLMKAGLAEINLNTEKYSDAETLYKQALPLLEKCDICWETYRSSLIEYADLLRKLNRPEEAKELDIKVQKLKEAGKI